ncbi:MAG: hypothetical protein M3Z17_05975 [Gemmatimonadota bacterium]|nr:hypothetical protein [Gemmatimonadota bacterium]
MRTELVALALLIPSAARLPAQTLSVSGSPGPMTVSVATAGSQPLAVSDATTTYSASALTSLLAKKITGQVNTNLPPGVTLTISLVAPSGASSSNAVTLDTTPRDLVVNITNAVPQSKAVTYTLSATVAAGTISSTSRTVTLTLVSYP